MLTLACSTCFDRASLGVLPFVLYWALLFAIWSLVWGLVGNFLAYRARTRLNMQPLAYALALVPTVFAAAVLLDLGLVPPAFVALLFWLRRVALRPPLRTEATTPAAERVARVATRARRVTLHLAALLVPLGYIRGYGHLLAHVEPFATWLIVPPELALSGSLALVWLLGSLAWRGRGAGVHADAREEASGPRDSE